MRSVQLTASVRSSALGFGCAPILGSVGSSSSRRALACALDCGITHFDIARSYGYGEAEKLVGRALRTQRDRVVIASKFGLQATRLAGWLSPLKPLVRVLRRRKPAATAASLPGPAIADRFHERIPWTPEAMTGSLERSLRALGTDYLDLFLVHEPAEELETLDDLCARAEALKIAGKIRAWGLAITSDRYAAHRASLSRFEVLQVDNSLGSPCYPILQQERSGEANAFFSVLRGAGDLKKDPAKILRGLAADFPRSVILCSMFNEAHIRANASALA